jgi:hypothetical protein
MDSYKKRTDTWVNNVEYPSAISYEDVKIVD